MKYQAVLVGTEAHDVPLVCLQDAKWQVRQCGELVCAAKDVVR